MDDGSRPVDRPQGGSSPGSGLYVDAENLHSSGQSLIQSLMDDWPDKIPAPTRLTLYVRADQAELWSLWATTRFSDLEVVVKGTQHFSMASTKNSADIGIATNAMADLILGRVSHIAVFSDDSDFISLYAAVRDEVEISPSADKVPFLWIVTDRKGSLSATVKQFFPSSALHVVSMECTNVQPNVTLESATSHWTEMAKAVVEDIPVGPFKSTDCQPVIKERWPDHPVASTGGSPFGIEFKNNIWPILQSFGVTIKNPGKKPIQYEMSAEAKKTLE